MNEYLVPQNVYLVNYKILKFLAFLIYNIIMQVYDNGFLDDKTVI